jgi:hypothetical protein
VTSSHHKAETPAPYPSIPPPPGHHQHSYQSYAQQYYDYYYHYYGYSAPPPPPPPGYPGGAPPTVGYPQGLPPPPFWASQLQQNNEIVAANKLDGGDFKEEGNVPTAPVADAMPPTLYQPSLTQEEADHRIAMALQKQENAKAFEDRNRRFGSDRKSSRSTAFCAPGCRPRLLNDRALDEADGPGTPSRKRPAMSASHYVSSAKPSRNKPSQSHGIHPVIPEVTGSPVPTHGHDDRQVSPEEMECRPSVPATTLFFPRPYISSCIANLWNFPRSFISSRIQRQQREELTTKVVVDANEENNDGKRKANDEEKDPTLERAGSAD